KLIDNSIKARQDVLASDPLYVQEINQLQAAVEQQQKAIDDDRRSTDGRLVSLAKTFEQMQPAVDKLPADQKQVASAIQNRLNELSSARSAYVAATDTAGADNDAVTKQAQSDLQTP